MSDVNELRTLDVRIATELFGWKAPLTPHPTRPLARYATDWSLIPRLLKACVRLGWWFHACHDPRGGESLKVELVFSKDGSAERWVRRGQGDTLPLALCRAIVAVLDAMEETKSRES